MLIDRINYVTKIHGDIEVIVYLNKICLISSMDLMSNQTMNGRGFICSYITIKVCALCGGL